MPFQENKLSQNKLSRNPSVYKNKKELSQRLKIKQTADSTNQHTNENY